jgi:hypothetical protein
VASQWWARRIIKAVQTQAARLLMMSMARRCSPPMAGTYCNIIEAPWLVNGGHGASLRHHNGAGHRWAMVCGGTYDQPRWQSLADGEHAASITRATGSYLRARTILG